ncbi:MAG TPA: copper chaperone PCu(A)C [Rhodoferax sp.]|nr:copper chaperone PCu(A)C [Rhodoferax sp.]
MKTWLVSVVWAFAQLITTTQVQAHGSAKGDLLIDHPYAVPSLKGVANGSAYVRGIKNKGATADRLLGASTAVAERVEVHRMVTEGGVMRMREVGGIDLPPGETTSLRHGGQYHLMLMKLKRPLNEGDRFDLTLEFQRAGNQTVNVWVQKPRDGAAEHKH